MPPKKRAPSTNPKKKQANKRTIYAFGMHNGDVERFDDINEAKVFELEMKSIITEKRTFHSDAAFNAYVKSYKGSAKSTTPLKSNVPVVDSKLSPKDQQKLQKCLDKIADRRDTDAVEIGWKTTSRATVVGLIIRWLTAQREKDWRFKGEHVVPALVNYTEEFLAASAIVQFALTQLDYGPSRDMNGPPDQAEVKKWSSPKSKREMEFPVMTVYTHFKLPNKKYPKNYTAEKEADYINEQCRTIGKEIIERMKTTTFAACFESSTNNENIWRAISDKTNPNKNYLTFLYNAKVRVQKITTFNRYLVRGSSDILQTLLYESSRGKPSKYAITESDVAGDSANEEGIREVPDEEDDNEEDEEKNEDDEEADEAAKDADAIEEDDDNEEGSANADDDDNNDPDNATVQEAIDANAEDEDKENNDDDEARANTRNTAKRHKSA